MGPKFEPTVPKTSTTKGTESVLRGNATAERASANIHGAGISNPPIEPSQSRASNGKHSREISPDIRVMLRGQVPLGSQAFPHRTPGRYRGDFPLRPIARRRIIIIDGILVFEVCSL